MQSQVSTREMPVPADLMLMLWHSDAPAPIFASPTDAWFQKQHLRWCITKWIPTVSLLIVASTLRNELVQLVGILHKAHRLQNFTLAQFWWLSSATRNTSGGLQFYHSKERLLAPKICSSKKVRRADSWISSIKNAWRTLLMLYLA